MIGFDCYGLVIEITSLNYTVQLIEDGSPLHYMDSLCNAWRWSTLKSRYMTCPRFSASSGKSQRNIFLIFQHYIIVIRQKWILIIILIEFALQHSLLYYTMWAHRMCFYWVFSHSCAQALSSSPLTWIITSVRPSQCYRLNISMQSDPGEGKWCCNTVSCKAAVAVITHMSLQFHVCRALWSCWK